jgi:hypothetical protein
MLDDNGASEEDGNIKSHIKWSIKLVEVTPGHISKAQDMAREYIA